MNDPFVALSQAVRDNDTAQAATVLERHPELAARLNEPMADGSFGGTMLIAAVGSGNHEMIDFLLRAGADIDARSHWWAGGFGVLDSCTPELAPFLIERGATITAHAAARLGMLDRLTALVAADPQVVHARGADGQTPLHFASTIDIARVLLDHGADIDAKDVDHESTPAQWMLGDRIDVAQFLVSRGCRTDILMAAAVGALELVRRHLDATPESIRTQVSTDWFPMRSHRAGGTMYTWSLGSGKTAHVIAHERGHREILQWLMSRSPDDLQLVQACLIGDETLVTALLARRPDLVGTLSARDRHALPDAARHEKVTAVRLMLGAGWPVDTRGDFGATALHHAAWLGNLPIVTMLLGKGASVALRSTTYDMTPVGWAKHGAEHSHRCQAGDYAGVIAALESAGTGSL